MTQAVHEPGLGLATGPSADLAPDALRVGVFTLAGRHVADVELDLADTVLDLKREIRIASGPEFGVFLFHLVCGSSILEDVQTVAEAGLLDQPTVQLVAAFAERFFAGSGSGAHGLYLLPDGCAKAFALSTRIINRQEDEVHTQRIFYGCWTCGGAGGTAKEVVTVVFTHLERNVYNESAMAGWTSRSGRKPLAVPSSLELRREEGSARLPPDALLEDTLEQARVWLPGTLARVPNGEDCIFDAWHIAGTSTMP